MKTYSLKDAEAIFRDYGEQWLELKADGVHLRNEQLQFDPTQALHWKYVCELDGADSPNPLTAPCLPFPFTANQLAAFMLDGVGAVIPSVYGNWENGPDQGMLDSMGVLAREPRRAMTEAYTAYMTAQGTVGPYPSSLEKRVGRLSKIHSYRNGKANKHEGVFADGITPSESLTRRERAVASNLELGTQLNSAKNEYEAAFNGWRKAMVRQLLQPAPAQSPTTPAPVVVANIAPPPLARFAAQEAAALGEIVKLGYDPLTLPKNKPGKPGVKAAVSSECLKNKQLFVSRKVFENCWERLTAIGALKIQK